MKAQFNKKGWIYIPVTVGGWIVTLVYLSVCTYTLVAIIPDYNSLYHGLIRFFPYFISFSVVFFWIAGNTSNNNQEKK
jgi:hypothetical protein